MEQTFKSMMGNVFELNETIVFSGSIRLRLRTSYAFAARPWWFDAS